MEEKVMVKETFEETKNDLLTFQRVIIETKNIATINNIIACI